MDELISILNIATKLIFGGFLFRIKLYLNNFEAVGADFFAGI